MDRREILSYMAAVGLMPTAGTAAPDTAYSDAEAADEWMKRWMRQPGAAHGMLSVERFADRYYYLTKKIGWRPDDPNSRLGAVTVPAGFVTDFASIPRIAWSVLPPDGDYTYPAVVHDYLYWTQDIARADADEVFRLLMTEFKISQPIAATIYRGVRAGGGSAWAENARLKQSGERRILKVFPEDPRTRWIDWKEKDVFLESAKTAKHATRHVHGAYRA